MTWLRCRGCEARDQALNARDAEIKWLRERLEAAETKAQQMVERVTELADPAISARIAYARRAEQAPLEPEAPPGNPPPSYTDMRSRIVGPSEDDRIRVRQAIRASLGRAGIEPEESTG